MTTLFQFAYGVCAPMLELSIARHRSYCAARGIEYLATWQRPPFANAGDWQDKSTYADWLLRHMPDGHVLVILDADALIVGAENIADALPPDADMGLVRSARGWWNTGAWWLRNSEASRELIARITALTCIPQPGLTYGDQQALINEQSHTRARIAGLDARWNAYADATAPTPPVQIRAWHGGGAARLRDMEVALRHETI